MEEIVHNEEPIHKFVVGDFNARLRTPKENEYRLGKFRIRKRNGNGNHHVGLLSAVCLFYGNPLFEKREILSWIWGPPSMTHVEVDHIFANSKWCLFHPSVVSGFRTGCEHRLLSEKIRSNYKLGNNTCYFPRKRKQPCTTRIFLIICSHDWQINENSTED